MVHRMFSIYGVEEVVHKASEVCHSSTVFEAGCLSQECMPRPRAVVRLNCQRNVHFPQVVGVHVLLGKLGHGSYSVPAVTLVKELVVLEVDFVPCRTDDGEDDFECTIYSKEFHTRGTRRDDGHMYEGLCDVGSLVFCISHTSTTLLCSLWRRH